MSAPPLGIAYLASYIRKYDSSVNSKIMDYNIICTVDEFNKRDLAKDIDDADIVGISFMTPMIDEAMHIAKVAKESGKIVIVGGPHATALPDDMLESKYVDIVVRGEGEQTLLEIIDALKTSKNLSGINDKILGISYISNGKIIHTLDRPYIENVDDIPFPARDLLELEKYSVNYPGFDANKPVTSIMGSRGCPAKCIFCASNVVWRRQARFRSPENIVQEVESVINDFGINQFNFSDDTFTLKRNNVIETCDLIIEKNLDVVWACSTRTTSANREMFEKMKASGCTRIGLGIESANPEVIKNIKKGINIEKASEVIRMTNELGMEVSAYFLIGNPGESRKSIKDSIDFIIEHDLPSSPGIVEPFPGTEIHEIAKRNGHLRDFEWSQLLKGTGKPVMRTDVLSYDDIEALNSVAAVILGARRRGMIYGLMSMSWHMYNRPKLGPKIMFEVFTYYIKSPRWQI
ncbi:MAG: radical SAM protein [Thermoplasmata archaeon]|nr:radical SAM protein [Thermoplasmata archaeon]